MCLFISSIYAPAINLSHCEKKVRRPQIDQYNDRKGCRTSVDFKIARCSHWWMINEISKEIASGISPIKRIRYFLSFEILLNVYNSLVKPHFDYCDGVWGNCSKNLSSKSQKLQNCAAHVLTFSNYDCNTSELFQNLKWSKLVHQRLVNNDA